MGRMIRYGTGLLSALLLCCSRPAPVSSGRPVLYVSIPPQKYFTEKICADRYTVKVLMPPGASPHSYEPKPSQMAELASARLYFSIGIEMEKAWLPRIRKIYPRLTIVATDSGIVKLPSSDMTESGGSISANLNHKGQRHGADDPHIWLSPLRVKQQARLIAGGLTAIDTGNGRFYMERLAAFEADIDSLRMAIAQRLDSCGANRNFLVIHPSWGYFAADFSLRQIAVEVEGKEPGIRELGAIADHAKKEGITVVLVQPQFSRKIAETIARQVGIGTAVADPLAEDWPDNLLRVTEVLCGQ